MPDTRWMLYGATGYTGIITAEEAVARGHKPLLAGRDESKLAPLAERLDLDYVAVSLDDSAGLRKALEGVGAVLHDAGPFVFTAEPMRRACLDTRTHYLDITGEIRVFEATFACDAEANERGIVMIGGVGFDVVPTDCLAVHVADQVPGANKLEIGISTLAGGISAGTTKSGFEIMREGLLVRRDGKLVRKPLGAGVKKIPWPWGERRAIPFPWGDVATAYRSTGIPNITDYMRLPAAQINFLRWFGVFAPTLQFTPIRRFGQWWADRLTHGPSEQTRETGRSTVWARASGPDGNSAQGWLETVEAYKFTAISTVMSVERVLGIGGEPLNKVGALAPATAFGKDFALAIPGTKRIEG